MQLVGNTNNGPIIGRAVLELNFSIIFPGSKNISFIEIAIVNVNNMNPFIGANVSVDVTVQNSLTVHI